VSQLEACRVPVGMVGLAVITFSLVVNDDRTTAAELVQA
jgi:hypothetical protein